MQFDLAIHSYRTLTPDGVRDATIFIKNGKITAVADGLPEGLQCKVDDTPNTLGWFEQAKVCLDVKYDVLMPGIIDPHVHINEPGRTHWEGFETATKAAAAGGITTIADMPLNSAPVTTTSAAFQQKLDAAKGKLFVNCGFWGGIIPGNQKHIKQLAEKGVWGFKAFLTHSGIDEFPNVAEDDLRVAMPLIADCKLPLLVHCELSEDHPGLTELHTKPKSYKAYLNSRPKSWEDRAVNMVIRLAEEYKCRVHIVHVSSSSAIDLIRKAKEKGLPVTAETCAHYLYFNAEEIPDGSTIHKCAPPIREKANNDILWNALEEDVLDFITSDHSPVPPDLKEPEPGNFEKAWGGIAGIQFILPAVWTKAKERGMSIEKISELMSRNPAKFLRIDDKKGKIEKGFDADLTVWSPEESFLVSKDNIYFKHKLSPYINELLFGVVRKTYVKGKIVYGI